MHLFRITNDRRKIHEWSWWHNRNYYYRYVTPADRIILSNVCPTIPNKIRISELKNIGLTLLSQMTLSKKAHPDLKFITRFRRQIFISPTQSAIPQSIIITHDNTFYGIFLSRDNPTCCKCKQTGLIFKLINHPTHMISHQQSS